MEDEAESSRSERHEVTPALALDAGFTVAYQTGAPTKSADAAALRKATETCLDKYANQPLSPGACFGVGYVHGAQAYANNVGKGK